MSNQVHLRELTQLVSYETSSSDGFSHMYSTKHLDTLRQEGTEYALLSVEETLFPIEERKNLFQICCQVKKSE
jgi:hypothetical protein